MSKLRPGEIIKYAREHSGWTRADLRLRSIWLPMVSTGLLSCIASSYQTFKSPNLRFFNPSPSHVQGPKPKFKAIPGRMGHLAACVKEQDSGYQNAPGGRWFRACLCSDRTRRSSPGAERISLPEALEQQNRQV